MPISPYNIVWTLQTKSTRACCKKYIHNPLFTSVYHHLTTTLTTVPLVSNITRSGSFVRLSKIDNLVEPSSQIYNPYTYSTVSGWCGSNTSQMCMKHYEKCWHCGREKKQLCKSIAEGLVNLNLAICE
jgi:hypothetical protein